MRQIFTRNKKKIEFNGHTRFRIDRAEGRSYKGVYVDVKHPKEAFAFFDDLPIKNNQRKRIIMIHEGATKQLEMKRAA